MTEVENYSTPSTWVEGFHDPKYKGKLKYVSLGQTGLLVSKLGFGGSAIGGSFSAVNEEESIEVVRQAFKRGINYVDTAPWYGNGKAETVLGKALQGIPREAYYVATKIGRYKPNVKDMFDFSAERTFQSVEESLQRLQLDYVDILQIHDLEFSDSLDIIFNETLPALQKIKESGKAKFIGITGYPIKILKEVIENSSIQLDTVLSYCRCCLIDTSLLDYIDYFKEKKLGIINAASLAMGLLTNGGPASWHPASNEIKQTCVEAAKYCKEKDVDIAKLGLYYAMNQTGPHVHLVSAAEHQILDHNLDVAINGLTDSEKDVLDEVLTKFFKPLTIHHWEGVEIRNYWNELKKLKEI